MYSIENICQERFFTHSVNQQRIWLQLVVVEVWVHVSLGMHLKAACLAFHLGVVGRGFAADIGTAQHDSGDLVLQ